MPRGSRVTRPSDHNGFAYQSHLKENSGHNKSSIVDAAQLQI